jgi:hypothetical protein
MAYATAADVEIYLGTPFVGDQEDAATLGVAAASDHIDRVTGRTWVAGTVTGEVQQVYRDAYGYQSWTRLSRPPVTAISSLAVRSLYLGATSTVLTSPSGYDLVDPATGLVLVNATAGDMVTVTYTSSPTVPSDIKEATIMLAAEWLSVALSSASSMTYSKIKAGSAELTFRDVDMPPRAKLILDSYRSGLVFA